MEKTDGKQVLATIETQMKLTRLRDIKIISVHLSERAYQQLKKEVSPRFATDKPILVDFGIDKIYGLTVVIDSELPVDIAYLIAL